MNSPESGQPVSTSQLRRGHDRLVPRPCLYQRCGAKTIRATWLVKSAFTSYHFGTIAPYHCCQTLPIDTLQDR